MAAKFAYFSRTRLRTTFFVRSVCFSGSGPIAKKFGNLKPGFLFRKGKREHFFPAMEQGLASLSLVGTAERTKGGSRITNKLCGETTKSTHEIKFYIF